MTDTTPSTSSVVFGVFDGNRPSSSPAPTDAAVSATLPTTLFPSAVQLSESSSSEPPSAPTASPRAPSMLLHGKVRLNAATLRYLREVRWLSQQDLADDCWRRNFRVSIATIKRAETGHDVRFRIGRELARYFGVPFDDLLR